MLTIKLTQPDDAHLHLRDGAALTTTVPASSAHFARAIVMPNLVPAITTVEQALAYRTRILQNKPSNFLFNPLMALYLTDHTTIDEIIKAKAEPAVIGYKLYPAGATTHSAAGVTNLEKLNPVFAKMEELQLPLLIHGEVTDPDIDIFDRELYFIEKNLQPLLKRFPQLPVVLEHITTSDAAQFVLESSAHLAATITVHHLYYNRNDMLVGGIRPHLYCLPILKAQQHQAALIKAATCGSKKFFLGTDSAPHAQNKKETTCGCAGLFTAPLALPCYAEIFEREQALDKFEAFASFNMADFYGLPRNTEQITLEKTPWTVPASYPFADEVVIPFRAGETLSWQVV